MNLGFSYRKLFIGVIPPIPAENQQGEKVLVNGSTTWTRSGIAPHGVFSKSTMWKVGRATFCEYKSAPLQLVGKAGFPQPFLSWTFNFLGLFEYNKI